MRLHRRAIITIHSALACLGVVALICTATATGAAAAGPGSPAGGGFAAVDSIADVSGTSPFAYQSCNVVTSVWMHPGGQASETTIAVNPTDPRNEIGAWMDGAAGDLVTAYTTDGGQTWAKVVPQGLDQCTGDHSLPYEDTCDEWLSFGPDGTAYLATMPFSDFSVAGSTHANYVSQVKVVTSRDGGRTWSPPVIVPPADAVFDSDMILADPVVPGTVYETMTNNGYGFVGMPRGETEAVFNKSTDYGKTWKRTLIDRTGTATGSLGINRVAALPDGTLVFLSSRSIPGGSQIRVFRSADRGSTWSGPVNIYTATGTLPPVTIGSTSFTLPGPTQIVAVNSHTVAFLAGDRQAYARNRTWLMDLWESTDSGLTWTSKPVLTSPYPIVMPAIGTDPQGRIGVTWFEAHPADTGVFASPALGERQRFAVIGRDGNLSVPVTVGAAWWNLYSPAYGSNWRQGDYIQVRATPGGFATIAPQGPTLIAGPEAVPLTGNTVDGVVVADIDTPGAR